MHIAICDDNVANRKHLERLLQRESDARTSTTGVFYVDSFGNRDALLKAPKIYNFYLFHMNQHPSDLFELASLLRAEGCHVPFAFIGGQDQSHSATASLSEPFYFLEDPVQTAALHQLLNQLLSSEISNKKISTIEIRSERTTEYMNPSELLFATEKKHLVILSLKNNQTLEFLGTLKDLDRNLESYPNFYITKTKYLININEIFSLSSLKVTLKNQIMLPLHISDYIAIKELQKHQKKR